MKKQTHQPPTGVIVGKAGQGSPFRTTARKTAFRKEDLLLKLGSLNEDAVIFKTGEVAVANFADGFSAARGEDATGIYRKDQASKMGAIGVSTGMPLNETSQYTVRFAVRMGAGKEHFLFGFTKSDIAGFGANVMFYGMPHATQQNYQLHMQTCTQAGKCEAFNYYQAEGNSHWGYLLSTSAPWWEEGADADGYVTVTITLDRGIMMVYLGERRLGGWNLGDPYKRECDAPAIKHFTELILTAGFAADGARSADGTVVSQVRDIEVYRHIYTLNENGEWIVTVPQGDVIFETENGTELINTRRALAEGELRVEKFPAYASTKYIYWTEKESGALVEAPYVCTRAMTFVAHEVDVNAVKVIGIQKSTKQPDGTLKIRFLGGTWTLDGAEIGMDICTHYTPKEASEVTTVKNRIGSTAVYREMQAEQDGELKNYTAKELGVRYLFAIEMEGVPTDIGMITFQLSAFKKLGDTYIFSESKSFTYREGWTFFELPAYPFGKIRPSSYNCGSTVCDIFKDGKDIFLQKVTDTTAEEVQQYAHSLQSLGYQKEYEHHIAKDLYLSLFWKGRRVWLAHSRETLCICCEPSTVSLADFEYTYIPTANERSEYYLYGIPTAQGVDYRPTESLKLPNCGQLLLIKCADNSVIIVDGGDNENTQLNKEAQKGLDAFLRRITNTEAGEKVRISAWYLTHYHPDHCEGFFAFLQNYQTGYVLERIVANVPKNTGRPEVLYYYEFLRRFAVFVKETYPGCRELKVHTGQVIRIADVSLQVLYTHEDLLNDDMAFATSYTNETSTVIRVDNGRMSMMVLGDIFTKGANVITSSFPPEILKSDVLQAAHHNYHHLPTLNAAVSPKIVFVPNSRGSVISNSKPAGGGTDSDISFENLKGLVGEEHMYWSGNETVGVAAVDGQIRTVYRQSGVIGLHLNPDGTRKPEYEE